MGPELPCPSPSLSIFHGTGSLSQGVPYTRSLDSAFLSAAGGIRRARIPYSMLRRAFRCPKPMDPLGNSTRLWGHPYDPLHRETCGTIDTCAVARTESRGSAVPDWSRHMDGREHWDPDLAARAACGSCPGRTCRSRNIRWPHHPCGHQATAVFMRHTEGAPVAPYSPGPQHVP